MLVLNRNLSVTVRNIEYIVNNFSTNQNILALVSNALFWTAFGSILLPWCPILSVDIRKGKKARDIHVAGLSCLWDTGASDSMIKKSFVRKFQEDFRKNKQQYDTAGDNQFQDARLFGIKDHKPMIPC